MSVYSSSSCSEWLHKNKMSVPPWLRFQMIFCFRWQTRMYITFGQKPAWFRTTKHENTFVELKRFFIRTKLLEIILKCYVSKRWCFKVSTIRITYFFGLIILNYFSNTHCFKCFLQKLFTNFYTVKIGYWPFVFNSTSKVSLEYYVRMWVFIWEWYVES